MRRDPIKVIQREPVDLERKDKVSWHWSGKKTSLRNLALCVLDIRGRISEGFTEEWYRGVLGEVDAAFFPRTLFISPVRGKRKLLEWWFRPVWLFLSYVVVPIVLRTWRVKGNRIILLDLHDQFGFGRYDLPLLRHADLIFKRELPPNRWQSFVVASGGIAHPGMFRRGDPVYQKIVDRILPISLGVPDEDVVLELDFSEKEFDVFYTGDDRGLSSRIEARKWCMALKREGFRVLMPDERMSKYEFLKALRKSWMCFSPPGNGWDCFRHYEVGACGSLPVMEWPTIEAYEGYTFHEALFVRFGDDESLNDVRRLLRDQNQMLEMIRACHARVLRHHTHFALQSYMQRELKSCSVSKT